ncbi:MAG: 50S ribosomal protein L30 [Vampirovibrionales bacterium]
MTSEKKLSIALTRSLIGVPEKQIRVVRALGLHKTNDIVVRSASVTILGMIHAVRHLVTVQEV